jgi:hypothetical protein
MSIKTNIVLAAVLFSAIASPVFASNQDVATVTENSGRLAVMQTGMPHAYASAARNWRHAITTQDFQLQGRGL